MRGVVFTEFLDWVEARHGLAVLDALIQASELPNDGAYTSIGTYDWREFVRIASRHAADRGVEVGELLREFGRELFAAMSRRLPAHLRECRDATELLLAIDRSIHADVRRLHPAAELPQLDVTRDGAAIVLRYRSERPFAALAHGLIEGCLAHCGSPALVAMSASDGGAEFRVESPVGAACRSN